MISPSPDVCHISNTHQSIKDEPKSSFIDLSTFSEAEIRAFKKQQRMIKNRYVIFMIGELTSILSSSVRKCYWHTVGSLMLL